MRILYIADGRSPIALNWIHYFVESGHEVHLASTFPCSLDLRLASLHIVPVALPSLSREGAGDQGGVLRRTIPVEVRTRLRQWLAPVALPGAAQRMRQVIDRVQPNLVHAMRIPYEGMLAALANPRPPLLVSVWGNDFTLHASANPLIKHLTRQTMRRTDALHTDCHRDRRLAHGWGFPHDRPAITLPGAGGVQLDVFYPGDNHTQAFAPSPGFPIVINPRGTRAYVRNDTFFCAIPLILEEMPRVRFICPAMEGESQALRWVEQLGIAASVDLLPPQTRLQMAALYRQAQVAVSLTTHDGTPNTLLEAMACGCTPVAGDLESLREWITPGVNGLLVEAGDPQGLAQAVLLALQNAEFRLSAKEKNLRLVTERADYRQVMAEADRFYRKLVSL